MARLVAEANASVWENDWWDRGEALTNNYAEKIFLSRKFSVGVILSFQSSQQYLYEEQYILCQIKSLFLIC